jgi:hypothetical protein
MTTIAILQPHFLPWLGYFNLINRVDNFVYLDDVQYITREWKNRNKIRKISNSDDYSWLSVPVEKKATRKKIKDVQINNNLSWRNDHLQKIRNTYLHSPEFESFFPIITSWYQSSKSIDSLSLLNKFFINKICNYIGINTSFIDSSDLSADGVKDYKLLDICLKLNAKKLIANNRTAEYANISNFLKQNVSFIKQDFVHPDYGQYNKNVKVTFMPFLSTIDACFNVSQNNIKNLLSN